MENIMKKYDVVALGELLIDFTENGKSNQGNPLFEANPGGAPCNVLAMLTKLGHKTAFIGKVGEDFFGEQLRDAITEVGIDADGLCTDKEIHTTLAMGKEGSRAYYNGTMVEVKPFLQKNTIETTGAGDTFCGCVLHYICEHGMEGLEEENLKEMLTFANAAASVITTRKGALRVMPTRDEIQNLQC